MKSKIFTAALMSLTLTCSALGDTLPKNQIEVLAKIYTTGHAIKLIRLSEKDVIPSILQDQKLEEAIARLDPDSEALVKGHITYHATTLEGQVKLEPIFIIESINPISLRLIGKIKAPDDNELASSAFRSPDKSYAPFSIPVTTELASAITMTSAVLLMQSLAANPNQPDTKQQVNTGMFLFAGVLATSVFIYDQIKSKHK
jgi:hypothetical protein